MPNRPALSGTSRALCQSVTYTSWSASSTCTVWRSRVAKCPDIGATSSTRGWRGAPSFLKCSRLPNGPGSATTSSTASRALPWRTGSSPKAGRAWVTPEWPKVASIARAWRSGSSSGSATSKPPSIPAPPRAKRRIGTIMSCRACQRWYIICFAATPQPRRANGARAMPEPALLRISSRNYSSWSLRGFLLARLSGLPFTVQAMANDDPQTRAELLMQSSSIRIPCLLHDGAEVWDTMAIAEYLNETCPKAGMLPKDRLARARCRSISGEMHAGFHALRSSLPMNLRARHASFTVWSAARADIERITETWRGCLGQWRGPWLFGAKPRIADAFYAPVVTRLRSYGVALDPVCEGYAQTILGWPDMAEWAAEAEREMGDKIEELELDAEF